MTIPPDTKDWTWVLERRCPECGLDAGSVDVAALPELLRRNASAWTQVLGRSDVGVRPDEHTWSPLEYACHVRDVHVVFDGRYAQLLADDDPQFANWDQDEAAAEADYGSQDPLRVGTELGAAAARVADRLAAVTGSQWERAGRRSNGSLFTVASLGRYHVHDVVHHLRDVHG